MVSDGKYYLITPSTKNGLDVASEPSDIDTSSTTTNGNETITANSDNENVSAVVSGKTITLSSESITAIQDASKKSAEKLYPSTNSYLRSALVNGTMWDTAIKFIQLKGGKNDDANHQGVNSDSTNWGNHNDSEFNLDNYKMYSTDYGMTWTSQNVTGKVKDNSQLIRTGAGKNATEVLNISDMAGNLRELTNEKVPTTNSISSRGCHFGDSGIGKPASYRGTSGYSYGWGLGFRIALYIK